MDDMKNCKISACCKTHWRSVLGLILVILGTILTVATLSGLGIFGMFLAGIALCCHKHLSAWAGGCGCGCGCGCEYSCSPEDVACSGIEKEKVVVEKKTTAKKSST